MSRACNRGLSERRDCGVIGLARSSLGYTLRPPATVAPFIAAMKTLSALYPRYGDLRIRNFLHRLSLELSWSHPPHLVPCWPVATKDPPAKICRQ